MQIAKWGSVAVLVALLALRTSALTCQQLANSTDGCDFYTDCLEVASPCGPSGYALAYGNKYCLRFGEQRDLFNAAGQTWIDNVRRCLKNALLNNTAVYNSRNCKLIEDYAFSTHPTCYVDNGFCSKIVTSLKNLRGLVKVFDFSDFLSKRAIAQVYDTAKLCLEKVEKLVCSQGSRLFQLFCGDINRFMQECQADLDVVFLLDQSAATSSGNFQSMKSFVINVLSDLNVRPDGTRIGVVSSGASIPLGSYRLSAVTAQIQNIPFTEGHTDTASELIKATSQFNNSRTSQAVPQIIILLTDGISNLHSTVEAAAATQAKGIHLITVGIGKGMNLPGLSSIALSPDLVFSISSFSHTEFQKALRPLQQAVCYSHSMTNVAEGLDCRIEHGESKYLQYQMPPDGFTIQTTMNRGAISIYGSFMFRNPTALTSDFQIENVSQVMHHYVTTPPSSIRKRRAMDSNEEVTDVYITIVALQNRTVFSVNTTLGNTSGAMRVVAVTLQLMVLISTTLAGLLVV